MRIFGLLIVSAFLIVNCIYGQQDIVDDDDILRLFEEGELDYQSFSQILKLYDNKINANGPELDELTILPGIYQSDIEQIKIIRKNEGGYFNNYQHFSNSFGFKASWLEPFIRIVSPKRKYYRVGFDLYNNSQISDIEKRPYNRADIFLQGKRFDFDIVLKNDLNYEQDFLIDYRQILFHHKKHSIIFGNFRRALGNGLIFGRALYVPKAYRKTDCYLLYPEGGQNNGLYWQLDDGLSPAVALNIINYDSLEIISFSSKISYKFSDYYDIGLVHAFGEISDSERLYNQNSFSLFSNYNSNSFQFESELGILDNNFGLSCAAKYYDGEFGLQIGGWAYDENFAPLFSNGISDRKGYLEINRNDVYEQKSYQAGQFGNDITFLFPISDILRGRFYQSYFQNHISGQDAINVESSIILHDFWNDSRALFAIEWQNENKSDSDYNSIYLKSNLRKSFNEQIDFRLDFNLMNSSKNTYEFDYYYENEYPDIIEIEESARRWRLIASSSQSFSPLEGFDMVLGEKLYKYDLGDPKSGYFQTSLEEKLKMNDIYIDIEANLRFYFDDSDKLWNFKVKLGYDTEFSRIVKSN